MTSTQGSRPSEAGVATVSAVTWVLVIATLAWIGILVAAVTARQHEVDGAADLAAISAAGRLQRGDEPCRVAADIAARNDVVLRSCRIDVDDVLVVVEDTVRVGFGIQRELVGHARAGPADS